MTDHTPMQRALDAEELVADLAKRVAELEKALRPFAQVAEFDIGSNEADGDTYRPMDVRYANAEPIKVGHLRRAHAALSTPSVGGSLAEENERLREAIEAALASIRHQRDWAYIDALNKFSSTPCLGWKEKVRAGRFGADNIEAHAIANEMMGRHKGLHSAVELIDAALSGKEPK